MSKTKTKTKTLATVVADLEAEVDAILAAAKHEPDREGKLELRAEANGIRIALSRLRPLLTTEPHS